MILLDDLVRRHYDFRNVFTCNFVEYCRRKGEPCSVAYMSYTIIDEDCKTSISYARVTVIRDVNNTNKYNSFFELPNLNGVELNFFIVPDKLPKKPINIGTRGRGYDNSLQIRLTFDVFEHYINIQPSMIYFFDYIRLDNFGYLSENKDINIDLLYNSIAND
ncbi:MAG: hypothetical protein QXH92_03810 [Candidatus Aenigmatarchaeota archaeon]